MPEIQKTNGHGLSEALLSLYDAFSEHEAYCTKPTVRSYATPLPH